MPLLGMWRQLRPGVRVEEGHGGCARRLTMTSNTLKSDEITKKSYDDCTEIVQLENYTIYGMKNNATLYPQGICISLQTKYNKHANIRITSYIRKSKQHMTITSHMTK